MTLSTSKATVRHTLVSTLTALVLAAALPQAASAMNTPDEGIWRIDPSKSTYRSGSATFAIERVARASAPGSRFIVVSKGNVYVVGRGTADDGNGVRNVDYGQMMRDGNAVLIGTNARVVSACGFRCQSGLPESRLTLAFRAVSTGQQINEMIAAQKQ